MAPEGVYIFLFVDINMVRSVVTVAVLMHYNTAPPSFIPNERRTNLPNGTVNYQALYRVSQVCSS